MTDEDDIALCDGVEMLMATLYLMEQYSVVQVEGEALRVQYPNDRTRKKPGQIVRVPLAKVEQVMVMGDVTLTTPALHTLLERRIPVHYFSVYGQSYGTLVGDPAKNAGLRLAQYALHRDIARRFAAARQCVAGKLHNMRTTLLRYARDQERETHKATLLAAAQQLRTCLRELAQLPVPTQADPDDRMHGLGALLGLEGSGTAAYYGVLGVLLKGGWTFPGRVKRPPTDPVNSLLSFGYAILTSQVASQVWAVGLDPAIGVLHQPGFGKPALALDLVEEFRPVIVDSLVITLLNTNQLKESDFDSQLGAYRLTDDARKHVLTKLEEKLQSSVQHPTFGYKTTYRRCIELQARLLAKYAHQEIDQYIPFTVR